MIEDIPFTHNDYEILDREVLYQGVFRLARYSLKHCLFDGTWSSVFTREVFERYPATGVLPYDPILDRVILIQQFRPGSLSDPKSPWLIEIPAGVLGKTEKPDEVAYREATEETGCIIQKLYPISDYFVSPGGSNEYIHLYCGKINAEGVEGIHGLKHENEDIRVMNLTADEAFTQLALGKIKTAPAIIALLWLQLYRKVLQKEWR
jgi:ADP-ribose pyrophosphatase